MCYVYTDVAHGVSPKAVSAMTCLNVISAAHKGHFIEQ